jgi:hypothetical protein
LIVIDVQPFVDWIRAVYEPSVRVGGRVGHYARQPDVEAIDLYGVADLACVLYTIGHLAPDEHERMEWADAFATFQTDDGSFIEAAPTHDRLHSTAFTLAAMELLGLQPRRPLTIIEQYADAATIEPFLSELDWRSDVYMGSHRGAGLGSIMSLDARPKPGWFDTFFGALDQRFDPANGLLGEGKPAIGDLDQIGGTFHYHFLYEWHHRRMPFPRARIDAVLGLQQANGFWTADSRLWVTLDAMYLLTRTVEGCGYRRADVDDAVWAAAQAVDTQILAREHRDECFGWYLGAHSLTAATAIVAEAQRYAGAERVRTDRPLRLVLDRRPFI